jgi:hypothetical protein
LHLGIKEAWRIGVQGELGIYNYSNNERGLELLRLDIRNQDYSTTISLHSHMKSHSTNTSEANFGINVCVALMRINVCIASININVCIALIRINVYVALKMINVYIVLIRINICIASMRINVCVALTSNFSIPPPEKK